MQNIDLILICEYKVSSFQSLYFLTIFPVEGIVAFRPPELGSYLVRAAASYLYERLLAPTLNTTATTPFKID